MKNEHDETKIVGIDSEVSEYSAHIKDVIAKTLYEHNAQDISILSVAHLTALTEYFVICTASSTRQVMALADYVEEQLDLENIKPNHRDGVGEGKWCVLDFGGVILHIFNDETRMFYCLDKLWSDGTNIEKYHPEDDK